GHFVGVRRDIRHFPTELPRRRLAAEWCLLAEGTDHTRAMLEWGHRPETAHAAASCSQGGAEVQGVGAARTGHIPDRLSPGGVSGMQRRTWIKGAKGGAAYTGDKWLRGG